jgi:hypothetical protein
MLFCLGTKLELSYNGRTYINLYMLRIRDLRAGADWWILNLGVQPVGILVLLRCVQSQNSNCQNILVKT